MHFYPLSRRLAGGTLAAALLAAAAFIMPTDAVAQGDAARGKSADAHERHGDRNKISIPILIASKSQSTMFVSMLSVEKKRKLTCGNSILVAVVAPAGSTDNSTQRGPGPVGRMSKTEYRPVAVVRSTLSEPDRDATAPAQVGDRASADTEAFTIGTPAPSTTVP